MRMLSLVVAYMLRANLIRLPEDGLMQIGFFSQKIVGLNHTRGERKFYLICPSLSMPSSI